MTTIFQFDHITLGRKNKYKPTKFSFDKLRKILVKWQNFTQEHDLIYTLFTDNHDNAYFLSRTEYAKTRRYELATALASVFFLLKGVPILYQTQEYGAINPYYKNVSDFREVETLQYYNARKEKIPQEELIRQINLGSRDNTRRPFAWTDDKTDSFGFSKAKPWIPLHSLAGDVNLEKDKKSEKSVFSFYQKLLYLRKSKEVLRYGEFTDLTGKNKDCFLYKRSYQNKEIIVVCNFEKTKSLLPDFITDETHKTLLSNRKGNSFEQIFQPFEVVIYEKL